MPNPDLLDLTWFVNVVWSVIRGLSCYEEWRKWWKGRKEPPANPL